MKGVACGGDHTLVLLENGDVLGCGDNSSGQLALGHSVGVNTVDSSCGMQRH